MREKHKLIKPHRHRGNRLKVGDEIELRPDQVERLRKREKIAGGNKPKLTSVDNKKKGD